MQDSKREDFWWIERCYVRGLEIICTIIRFYIEQTVRNSNKILQNFLTLCFITKKSMVTADFRQNKTLS